METEIIDARLAAVLSEQEYRRLKTQAEGAYRRIAQGAPGTAADLAELVQVMRAIEAKLLDDRLGAESSAWAQGTMATLA